MYDELIDRLTTYFTSGPYRDEIAAGKKEFFDEAGVMDEESHAFEMRMTQFLEWYLFTRVLSGKDLTPAQYALQERDFAITPAEQPAFENLASTRHCLFEFQKIRGEDIHVKDLILDKKVIIPNSPINIGFNRDEIFSARLIPDGESFQFSRAFCFHPADATKYILSEIKRVKKTGSQADVEQLILKLLRMRYKYEQYRHLKLELIYTNEKKVRF